MKTETTTKPNYVRGMIRFALLMCAISVIAKLADVYIEPGIGPNVALTIMILLGAIARELNSEGEGEEELEDREANVN